MKVSVLVFLIVLPMLATIGLYSYAFISTNWTYIDQTRLESYSREKPRERLEKNSKQKNSASFKIQKIRHAFRSRYGLFSYCLDYKWIPLLTVDSTKSNEFSSNSVPFCYPCNSSMPYCSATRCCMRSCDNIADCPTYEDEKNCPRQFNQTRYYSPESNCIFQSTWIFDHPVVRYLKSNENHQLDFQQHRNEILHFVMISLFLAAPIFTLLCLLIIFCINCVERFYSIPFAFVGFFSFTAFLCGAGALGLFLNQWIQDLLHGPDYIYESDQTEALIIALNPWLLDIERFGWAFWISVAAISTSLFTTILSCCFCCGLQSEKSKLRFHVHNSTYEIMQMAPYED